MRTFGDAMFFLLPIPLAGVLDHLQRVGVLFAHRDRGDASRHPTGEPFEDARLVAGEQERLLAG